VTITIITATLNEPVRGLTVIVMYTYV